MNIAIVGAGISGLSTAWFLAQEGHNVSVFEKSAEMGGHATELNVEFKDVIRNSHENVKVNIAYDIFNKETYPRYIKLLEEIGIDLKPCDFNYSFRNQEDINTGDDRSKLFPVFADKNRALQLCKKDFTRLAWFSNKLSRKAKRFMSNPESGISFKAFLESIDIPNDLIDGFYIPVFARPWGLKPSDMSEMPAEIILDWLNRLRILTPKPVQWYKNEGGVKHYIDCFTSKLKTKGVELISKCGVSTIHRDEGGVKIFFGNGKNRSFDKVVIATNAKLALKVIDKPSKEELVVLRKFKYQKNNVLVHTDKKLMPKSAKDWSYFNIVYNKETNETYNTVHFGMEQEVPVFLTNYRKLPKEPSKALVIAKYMFEQPILNSETRAAQVMLSNIQGLNNTWYVGAHCLGHGHHESGVESGYIAAKQISKTAD